MSLASAPLPTDAAALRTFAAGLQAELARKELEIAANAAEIHAKTLALGRKNYLFWGSDAGGQRAACLYTIIETAKMNGINPQAYLADVLAHIADHPIHQINALLPWQWKPLPTAANG